MPTNLELELQLRKLEQRVKDLEEQHYHGIGTTGAGLNYSGLPIKIKNGMLVPLRETA